MYREHDNFENSYQYITEQLFIYDYSNADDLNILKSKILVLDGVILDEDPIVDDDVDNPKNHYASLKNELTFITAYNESPAEYIKLRDRRIKSQQRWIDSGKPDYEQPYSSRPTLLTDTEIIILHTAYLVKQNAGELTTPSEIITKASESNLDSESKGAEDTVENYIPPAQTEAKLLEDAIKKKDTEDDDFVNKMNNMYDELKNVLLSIEPDNPPFDNIFVNVPQKRIIIEPIKNDPSHKGLLINDEGYRFKFLDTNFEIIELTTAQPSDDPEWSFEDWEYYYSSETSGIFEPSGITKNDLPSIPDSDETPGALSRERFDELNKRWTNINRLREDNIQNIGTRVIIETMIDAEIPNLLPDHEDFFVDKKTEKETFTTILKETCEEFN